MRVEGCCCRMDEDGWSSLEEIETLPALMHFKQILNWGVKIT